jgi:hypothetical protein
MNKYKNIDGNFEEIDYKDYKNLFTCKYDENLFWESYSHILNTLEEKYNLRPCNENSSTLVNDNGWSIKYVEYSHPQCQEAEIEIAVISHNDYEDYEGFKYLYLKGDNCEDDSVYLTEKIDIFVNRVLKDIEENIISFGLII